MLVGLLGELVFQRGGFDLPTVPNLIVLDALAEDILRASIGLDVLKRYFDVIVLSVDIRDKVEDGVGAVWVKAPAVAVVAAYVLGPDVVVKVGVVSGQVPLGPLRRTEHQHKSTRQR